MYLDLVPGSWESEHYGSQERVENLRSLLTRSKLITKYLQDSDSASEDESIPVAFNVDSAEVKKIIPRRQSFERCESCNGADNPQLKRRPNGFQPLCTSCNSTGYKRSAARRRSPGRCRNCNKAHTAEWRRGPSNARSLCEGCENRAYLSC